MVLLLVSISAGFLHSPIVLWAGSVHVHNDFTCVPQLFDICWLHWYEKIWGGEENKANSEHPQMGVYALPRKSAFLYNTATEIEKNRRNMLYVAQSDELSFRCCACSFQSSAPFGPGHKLPPCPGMTGGCWWIINLLLHCLLLRLVKLISICLKKVLRKLRFTFVGLTSANKVLEWAFVSLELAGE